VTVTLDVVGQGWQDDAHTTNRQSNGANQMKTNRISRQEALSLLGCTERQLQRLAAKGMLTVEYVQEGKTRKATYSEAEVRALKQQQASPELRGIAVRPQEPATDHQPPATNHQSPLSLPPQAMQVLQMLGATSGIEAGKCVSVEEMRFEKLFVGADGSTRMSGVSVSRYSARA
jgi:hypothetical protein